MGVEIKIISDLIPQMLAKLPGVVSEIVRKSAFDIQAQAQENVPVKTGNLRASIGVEMTGDAEATITVGADYGPYVEYGTVHQPAKPYLTPAVEANRQPFLDAFKQLEEMVK